MREKEREREREREREGERERERERGGGEEEVKEIENIQGVEETGHGCVATKHRLCPQSIEPSLLSLAVPSTLFCHIRQLP